MLTKAGEPIEVAHIYPFSMRFERNPASRSTPSFWNTLRMFWSEERVNEWYAAIFPRGTEACHNLMCLAPHAHKYWEKAHFALKPIGLSDDKKRLDIQFFWLAKGNYASEVAILQRPLLQVHSDQGPNTTKLFNVLTEKKISSGDPISLETDDPVAHPLPDIRLLEMQWVLHRVAAMSAAAEAQDDFGDDSDDDLAAALQESWHLDTEDELDVDMDEVLDPDITESSLVPSLTIPSSSTVPSPSPQRPVPQCFPQLPREEKFKHTAATHEEEGLRGFSQTESMS